MPDIDVVLGPVASGSIVGALEAIDGVGRVLTPDMDGVGSALDETGDGVLVTFRWDDRWLDSEIRWLQSYTAGVDQFPIDRFRASGTVLTSAVGIHDVQVSEHAFGLLLALTRGIAQASRNQPHQRWEWPRVTDLAGMTMGILGLGVIGEAIAAKARSFAMDVIATKRDPSSHAGVVGEVVGPDQTLEVFERADVVVITLPGTPETRHMVGADELQALEGGYLVNVGRGSVVDEGALIEALEAGTLAGAGLDVFEEEPLPANSRLWELDNVVITPHLAGASPRYGERLAALFARNLEAHLGHSEWVNRVD